MHIEQFDLPDIGYGIVTLDEIKGFCIDSLKAIRELDVNGDSYHHAVVSADGTLNLSRSDIDEAFELADEPNEVIIKFGLSSHDVETVRIAKTAQGFSTSYPLHEMLMTLRDKELL